MKQNSILRLWGVLLAAGTFLVGCQPAAPATAEPAAATTAADTTVVQSQFGAHCYAAHMPDGSVLSLQFFDYYDEVVGILDYTFAEKDGAHGTFRGTRSDNMITALWSYTVEGSQQSEEVIFKLEGDKAFKASGELEESEDGTLRMKDPAKANWEESFDKINCKLGQ